MITTRFSKTWWQFQDFPKVLTTAQFVESLVDDSKDFQRLAQQLQGSPKAWSDNSNIFESLMTIPKFPTTPRFSKAGLDDNSKLSKGLMTIPRLSKGLMTISRFSKSLMTSPRFSNGLMTTPRFWKGLTTTPRCSKELMRTPRMRMRITDTRYDSENQTKRKWVGPDEERTHGLRVSALAL